jgi:hypothetical protein
MFFISLQHEVSSSSLIPVYPSDCFSSCQKHNVWNAGCFMPVLQVSSDCVLLLNEGVTTGYRCYIMNTGHYWLHWCCRTFHNTCAEI